MNKFVSLASENRDYSVAVRRDFHQYPELGFQEFRTSEIVAGELTSSGLEVSRNIGKTGVIGLLKGKNPGKTILLRFDMDALPIQEENSTDYVSKNSGVMHACGHDGHTAIGLTVAKIISQYRDQIYGTVKFIFQPAEEGLGGAQATIDDGVLLNPRPDFCLGLHLWNEKPIGWIGTNSGPMMAGADVFEIIIKGKGGHGGLPNLAIDPIVAAAQIVTTSQTIVSRNISPFASGVTSFCSINGGSTFNVIPAEVRLTGTIRTFDREIRTTIVRRLEEIAVNVGIAMGCSVDFSINDITPAVINDPIIANHVINIVHDLYPNFTTDDSFQTMGSEDYSLFLQEIPGCFFFVGSANNDKNLVFGHHHPKFDFDEEVLPISVSLMLGMLMKLDFLKTEENN
mgnify:CR=1 FL=1